jgi:hypothetical protein
MALESTDTPMIEDLQPTLLQQLYRHRIALISLFVALVSLGYNTWRNETSEAHRNIREAGFHMLREIGELEQIVSYRHYFYARADRASLPAHEDGDWVRGWGKVALIRDLSTLVGGEVQAAAETLFEAWQAHAADLELGPASASGRDAEATLDAALGALRERMLAALSALG